MAPALPVPSKGALRALRRIALGTSCTVAFGAGIVTEDRRRRIHSAREVHENAKRIKTSRKYHSGGTSVTAIFDEQVTNYDDYRSWKVEDKPRTLELRWSETPPDMQLSPKTEVLDSPRLATEQNPAEPLKESRCNYPSIITPWQPIQTIQYDPTKTTNPGNRVESLAQVMLEQRELAHNIVEILSNGSYKSCVRVATGTFVKSVDSGLRMDITAQPLQAACSLLLQASGEHGDLESHLIVFERIRRHGPMDEAIYYALGASQLTSHLLKSSRINGQAKSTEEIRKLKDAAMIFLADLSTKPIGMPEEMYKIGKELSSATLDADLYELTERIYWRLSDCRGENGIACVDHLILAESGMGRHKDAVDHFFRLYARTIPKQIPFYTVLDSVMDSAFKLREKGKDRVEEVIRKATEMAVSLGLVTSTTWLLRLLGTHWRETRNLESTKTMFERLEKLVEHTSHPQALYSAIIQYCVEAGHEADARGFDIRLQTLHGMDLRTSGHFALAKAMKEDWAGVEDDFRKVKSLGVKSPTVYSAIFTPILSTYATYHSVSEVEAFVRKYLEQLGVVPNQFILNVMVGVYARENEFDSITKWLEYVQPLGLQVDSVTVNTILLNCRRQLNIPFHDLFKFCLAIQKTGCGLIDHSTWKILTSAAKARAGADSSRAGQYLRMINSLEGVHDEPISDPLDAMKKAMVLSNFARVLRIYKRALRKNIPLPNEAVGVAVEASIKAFGDSDISQPVAIIQEARLKGLDVSSAMTPLLLCQLEGLRAGVKKDLVATVKRTMNALTERGLALPSGAITKATHVLVSKRRSRDAINLWISATTEDPTLDDSVDIVTLTVLLQACLSIFEFEGVRWILKTIGKRKITPDARFKLLVKNSRREAKRCLEAEPYNLGAQQKCEILDECFNFVKERRAQGFKNRKEAERKTLLIMENAARSSATGRRQKLEQGPALTPLSHIIPASWQGEQPSGPRQRPEISTWRDLNESEAFFEAAETKRQVDVAAAG